MPYADMCPPPICRKRETCQCPCACAHSCYNAPVRAAFARSAAPAPPAPPPRAPGPAARRRRSRALCQACECSQRPATRRKRHCEERRSTRAARDTRTSSPAVAARRTFSVDSCCISCGRAGGRAAFKACQREACTCMSRTLCASSTSLRSAATSASCSAVLWPEDSGGTSMHCSNLVRTSARRSGRAVQRLSRAPGASAQAYALETRSSSSPSVDNNRCSSAGSGPQPATQSKV